MARKFFLIICLTCTVGCSTIKGTRVEVITTTQDVWAASPNQSVSVKVVKEL